MRVSADPLNCHIGQDIFHAVRQKQPLKSASKLDPFRVRRVTSAEFEIMLAVSDREVVLIVELVLGEEVRQVVAISEPPWKASTEVTIAGIPAAFCAAAPGKSAVCRV